MYVGVERTMYVDWLRHGIVLVEEMVYERRAECRVYLFFSSAFPPYADSNAAYEKSKRYNSGDYRADDSCF